MKELPLSLKSLDQLEELNACHNQLEELPEAVLGTELKLLFATHNRLKSLSNSFARTCLYLEELSLSHNYLAETAMIDLISNLTIQLKCLRRFDVLPQNLPTDIASSARVELN